SPCLSSPPAPPTYALSLHDALPIFLRPLARVSPLPRIRGRACVPGAVPSDPRDLVRRGRSRDSDLRGHDAVLPEPCLPGCRVARSEEHTSELQSRSDVVCRLPLGKK